MQASLSVEDVEETPSQRALAAYLQSVSAALDAKTKDAPAKSPLLANSAVLRSLTRECRTVDQARGRVGMAGEGEKRENRRRWD